jgi:DNA-binding FadR family transcriptional regulator
MNASRPIAPIRPAAAHELALERLQRAIQLGRFLPGDRLPSERDLAEQLRVSRTTVRAAVGVLARKGLVTVRRGAAGGIVVRTPEPGGKRRELKAALEEIRIVYEYREAVECAAARLAAERRRPVDLRALGRLLKAMEALTATRASREQPENVGRFQAADSAFHLAIAQAAGNALLLRAVEDARAGMFSPVGAIFRRLEDNANDFHALIAAAIAAGDGEAAAAAMGAHIAEGRRRLEALARRGVPAAVNSARRSAAGRAGVTAHRRP